ncbi:MerR family transcriptional regulator [Winogradskyella eckloniae]|uniref:MerR family transcriptional regulator n=1 Tax=Winogradskyella eckloniae TaxID=1089306 RepID=UPI001563DDF0|nr:MerR family transcriptional regulator [Winogradskyella eckloniae]NRD21421.1 MerR family transcriptional regulator [Winogradskyella eckloniae]
MNKIKNQFSIKDLENLTGIKAHTIRIWEKRYNLLEPKRTDTNIRYYDLKNFKKLLNVSYLNSSGYKISKISNISDEDILQLVKETATKNDSDNYAVNALKLAMLNFDQIQFYKVYDSLLEDKPFHKIFYDVFIPLLSNIGVLWQTDTITPAHEHFISSLIKQKIILNTEKAAANRNQELQDTFVLFLPDNEIHEIGLMFIHYELTQLGYQSIFLGPSVPMDNLTDLQNYYNNITYISYFTIKPDPENLRSYLDTFHEVVLKPSQSKLWVLGQIISEVDINDLPKTITTFKTIKSLSRTITNA